MRRLLLINSLVLFVGLASCGTSENSASSDQSSSTADPVDTIQASVTEVSSADTVITQIENITLDSAATADSVRAITHGSPGQAELDSIKKSKLEQKKKN